MNIVTHRLVQRLDDPELAEWIEGWDDLEALMIAIYKAGAWDTGQAASLRRAGRWLRQRYPRWEEALRPFWHGLKAAGRPLEEDPFRAVLAAAKPEAVVDDWRTLQLLPAAREALNLYLLARVNTRPPGDPSELPSSAPGPGSKRP